MLSFSHAHLSELLVLLVFRDQQRGGTAAGEDQFVAGGWFCAAAYSLLSLHDCAENDLAK